MKPKKKPTSRRVDRCRVCGCTEGKACSGGCAWMDASKTICSRCYAFPAAITIYLCASCGFGGIGVMPPPDQVPRCNTCGKFGHLRFQAYRIEESLPTTHETVPSILKADRVRAEEAEARS